MNKQKLKEIFKLGLVEGLGSETEGTCIEGAIALAMGEGLTDSPSCVHEADRLWSIIINDAPWSSPQARAEALFPLALAQAGTAGKDRSKWVKKVTHETITKILPLSLRNAAKVHPEAKHRQALEEAAINCEEEGSKASVNAAYDAAVNADEAAEEASEGFFEVTDLAYATGAARAASYSALRIYKRSLLGGLTPLIEASLAADTISQATHYSVKRPADNTILRMAVDIALEAYKETSNHD